MGQTITEKIFSEHVGKKSFCWRDCKKSKLIW